MITQCRCADWTNCLIEGRHTAANFVRVQVLKHCTYLTVFTSTSSNFISSKISSIFLVFNFLGYFVVQFAFGFLKFHEKTRLPWANDRCCRWMRCLPAFLLSLQRGFFLFYRRWIAFDKLAPHLIELNTV